jgi:hypothetical protein
LHLPVEITDYLDTPVAFRMSGYEVAEPEEEKKVLFLFIMHINILTLMEMLLVWV